MKNTLRHKGRITAVLGSTNTGKTYLAIDRMLGHASGMIGFPLRLLARENYDKIVRIRGAAAVALMTGEEKIIPPGARYFVCTTESMPLDRLVSFLAIDEIQLCNDPERGHIFTDRLLHARGLEETMFLGAETIRPLLRTLVPGIEFVSRPRFSRLVYAGAHKLTRLPARSAIVAFSAADVYTIAELIRRQSGGAAVVLGALSPRTRNAQIDLYQAGEVDYIVATDAIGMGLNMAIDHVAFAALRKFDGRIPRDLTASEVAQIAGRAGRHMNDGTFGVTSDLRGMPQDIITSVEDHTFPPLRSLFWRNSELRFTSIDALLGSLKSPPDRPGLVRAREASDQSALSLLAREPGIAELASSTERLRLLWDVCQIPDFRKNLTEGHGRLLATIFRHLCHAPGHIPDDWLDEQIRRLDRTDGNIDTIMGRIAGIRIWTYIAYHGTWISDAVHWQERTRAVEDRLSDILHERLSQRFIDRRTAVLLRRLQDKETLTSSLDENGGVMVEGHFVGRLHGFDFLADTAESTRGTRAVLAAAGRALRQEIHSRVIRLARSDDSSFFLDASGILFWNEAPAASLIPGADPLHPLAEPVASELLDGALRDTMRDKLNVWLAAYIRRVLSPVTEWSETLDMPGAVRAILYRLSEGMGSFPRYGADAMLAALRHEERTILARLGVRLGQESVFVPALLKPSAQRLRIILWAVHAGLRPIPAPPSPGVVSLPIDPSLAQDYYEVAGYRRMGEQAVRLDILERWKADVRRMARNGPFPISRHWPSLLATDTASVTTMLVDAGYIQKDGLFHSPPKRARKPSRPPNRHRPVDPTHPFAKLHSLKSS